MHIIRRPIVQGALVVTAFAAIVSFAAFGAIAPPDRAASLDPQAEAAGARVVATPPPERGARPLGPLDESAAYEQLSRQTGWEDCLGPRAFGGAARVLVTFAATGRPERATVEGSPFAGTSTGDCIASKFRRVVVEPFAGPPRTLALVVVKPAPDRRPAPLR